MASHSNKDDGSWKIDPNFLIVFNSNFCSNTLRFRVITHFLQTRSDVIAISPTRWRRTMLKMADSERTHPVSFRRSIVFFLLSLTVFVEIEIFRSKGSSHYSAINLGFLGPHAPKFDFLSTRPPKGTSLRQTASFEPLTIKFRPAVRAVRKTEKVVKKK